MRLQKEKGNSIRCNYEVYCNLYTSRTRWMMIQRHSKLYSIPIKGGTEEFKGVKAKNKICLPVRRSW